MNASEAKALTEKALSATGEIRGLLDHTYGLIRTAATKGRSSIIDPLTGLRQIVTTAERNAVYAELRKQGFKVEHHRGDYSDPRERDYTEVSW
jgi:hypothetical protein